MTFKISCRITCTAMQTQAVVPAAASLPPTVRMMIMTMKIRTGRIKMTVDRITIIPHRMRVIILSKCL